MEDEHPNQERGSVEERRRLTRAAGVVGAATLLSRVFGFVRDVVIAYFFGAGTSADAFFVAFRLPNLLRRLFAEGAFTIAFVPVFTESLIVQGRQKALEEARSILTALGVALAVITVLGVVFAPAVVRVIAPGFADEPSKLALTVNMTRVTFPYIFFIGLVAGCMGVLNSLGHFAAPALAPVLLNMAMIFAAVFLRGFFEAPVCALAWGVFLGGVVQLLFQAPFMAAQGVSFRPCFRFRSPALKKVMALMGPSALGAAVYQISILVGTLLASLLASGSVSYLYYADRLVQFPLGVFGVALGTASLPSMSRFAASKDMDGFIDTFSYSMCIVLFVALPSMAGLIALRHEIIGVLFLRGAFDAQAAGHTASALLCYTLGLWAFSGIRIVLSGFYALQDAKTPVKVAILSLLANIGLSVVLMRPLKHNGLALAVSISSSLNFGLLVWLLRNKIGRLRGRVMGVSLLKTAAASVCMMAALEMVRAILGHGAAATRLVVGMLVGGAVYVGVARVLRSRELETLLRPMRRRRKGPLRGAASGR